MVAHPSRPDDDQEELKEDMKNSEGNPRVKAARRDAAAP